MSAARCISEPISWLELERFALDELPAEPATRVQGHLAACPVCARCLSGIRTETVALPDLPPARPGARPVDGRGLRRWRWTLLGLGATLAGATAAVALLATPAVRERAGTASKGMPVALTLVRERDGIVVEDPGGFRPDDRWKALVTCPGGREVSWALVLFGDGPESGSERPPLAPSEPGPPGATPLASPVASGTGLVCGNRVPLPGAFRLTGADRAAVCFLGLLGSAVPLLERAEPSSLEQAGAACVRLTREPPLR